MSTTEQEIMSTTEQEIQKSSIPNLSEIIVNLNKMFQSFKEINESDHIVEEDKIYLSNHVKKIYDRIITLKDMANNPGDFIVFLKCVVLLKKAFTIFNRGGITIDGIFITELLKEINTFLDLMYSSTEYTQKDKNTRKGYKDLILSLRSELTKYVTHTNDNSSTQSLGSTFSRIPKRTEPSRLMSSTERQRATLRDLPSSSSSRSFGSTLPSQQGSSSRFAVRGTYPSNASSSSRSFGSTLPSQQGSSSRFAVRENYLSNAPSSVRPLVSSTLPSPLGSSSRSPAADMRTSDVLRRGGNRATKRRNKRRTNQTKSRNYKRGRTSRKKY
jgi:hypothetical protein